MKYNCEHENIFEEELYMTVKLQIYKCDMCGNLIQVLQEGDGNLVCCGKEMELMGIQYDADELGEKHTPKTEIRGEEKFVHVKGHPMSNEHYIQFIESYSKDKNELYLKFFKPNEIPEMNVKLDGDFNSIEYCNIHHLWGNNVMLENENGNYSI